MLPSEFIGTFGPLARAAQDQGGMDYRVVLLQWAIETGWGSSPVCRNEHNLAGCKINERLWDAGYIDYEGSASTEGSDRRQRYAGFYTYERFIPYYVAILHNGLYDEVLQGRTPEEQIAALQRSPWVSPAGSYPGAFTMWRQHFARLPAHSPGYAGPVVPPPAPDPAPVPAPEPIAPPVAVAPPAPSTGSGLLGAIIAGATVGLLALWAWWASSS